MLSTRQHSRTTADATSAHVSLSQRFQQRTFTLGAIGSISVMLLLSVFTPVPATAAGQPWAGAFSAHHPPVCLPAYAQVTSPKRIGEIPFFQSSFEIDEHPLYPEIEHIDPETLTATALPRLDDNMPPMPSDWIVVSSAEMLSEPAPLDGVTQLTVAGFFDMANVLEPGTDEASIPTIRAIGLYQPWESTQEIPVSAETTALALVIDFLGTYKSAFSGGLKAGIQNLRNEPGLAAITAHIQAHLVAGTIWMEDDGTWDLITQFLPRAAEVLNIEPISLANTQTQNQSDCMSHHKSSEWILIRELSSGKLKLYNSAGAFPYVRNNSLKAGVTLQELDAHGRYIPNSSGIFSTPTSVDEPTRTYSTGPLDILSLGRVFTKYHDNILPDSAIGTSTLGGTWDMTWHAVVTGGGLIPGFDCWINGNIRGNCEAVWTASDDGKLDFQIPSGEGRRYRMCVANWDPFAVLQGIGEVQGPWNGNFDNLGLDFQDYLLRDAAFASSMTEMVSYTLEWLSLAVPKGKYGSSTAQEWANLVTAILLRQGDDYDAVHSLMITLYDKGRVLADRQNSSIAEWTAATLELSEAMLTTIAAVSLEATNANSLARRLAKIKTGDARKIKWLTQSLADAKKLAKALPQFRVSDTSLDFMRKTERIVAAVRAYRTRVNAESSLDAISSTAVCYILTRQGNTVDIKISQSAEGHISLPPGEGTPDTVNLYMQDPEHPVSNMRTAMLAGNTPGLGVAYFMPDITLGQEWDVTAYATRNGNAFGWYGSINNPPATAPHLFYTQADLELCGTTPPDPDFTISFNPDVLFMELGATKTGTVDFIEGYNGRPAAKFHGVDNSGRLIIPQNMIPTFDDFDGATFDMMVRRDSDRGMDGYGSIVNSGSGQTLFAKDHDRSGIGLMQGDKGNSWIATYDSTWNRSSGTVVNPADITLGEWHRVTVSASRSLGVDIYINGTLHKHYDTPNLSFSQMNAKNLVFGGFRDYWFPFNGAIQDFKIYKRALCHAEVAVLN